MKTKSFLLLAGLLISLCSAAQQKSRVKPWVSDQGFWVAQTNISTPKEHVIRFYTIEGLLIYEETVQGKRMNTDRRKTKIQLKKALDTVLLAYKKTRVVPAESLAVL